MRVKLPIFLLTPARYSQSQFAFLIQAARNFPLRRFPPFAPFAPFGSVQEQLSLFFIKCLVCLILDSNKFYIIKPPETCESFSETLKWKSTKREKISARRKNCKTAERSKPTTEEKKVGKFSQIFLCNKNILQHSVTLAIFFHFIS